MQREKQALFSLLGKVRTCGDGNLSHKLFGLISRYVGALSFDMTRERARPYPYSEFAPRLLPGRYDLDRVDYRCATPGCIGAVSGSEAATYATRDTWPGTGKHASTVYARELFESFLSLRTASRRLSVTAKLAQLSELSTRHGRVRFPSLAPSPVSCGSFLTSAYSQAIT